jgi:hypothetical protein
VPRDLRGQVLEHLHGPIILTGRGVTRRLVSPQTSQPRQRPAWTVSEPRFTYVQVPSQHIPVPTRCFSHIHVELVGPLPVSKGYTHLFTIMDRTFRWPEVIPITATSTVDCANALFQQIWSTGSHNIRLQDPDHLLPVGPPVQLAQHPAQLDNSLPPAV